MVYEVESPVLKQKCASALDKMMAIFDGDGFSALEGFKEDASLDKAAAYFTNDGLGYPAGYVIIRDDSVADWIVVHELAHAVEDSLFGDKFEEKCGRAISLLGDAVYRDVPYRNAERIADLITDNIDNNKIEEIKKCLKEVM